MISAWCELRLGVRGTYFKRTRHGLTKSDQHPRTHALILSQDAGASCVNEEIRLCLEEDMVGGGMRHQSAHKILIEANLLRQIFDGGSLARKLLKDLQAGQCQYTHRRVTLGRVVSECEMCYHFPY